MPEGARGKGNVYNTVARQAAMHSLETVGTDKKTGGRADVKIFFGRE